MIRSFNHKGLKEFFETGSKKGILPEHAPKPARIPDRLDSSTFVESIFYFKDKDAYLVDYLDYH